MRGIWWETGLLACISAMAILWLGLGDHDHDRPLIRIGTNPWPGYEYLHLAEQKGFLTADNLDIQLVRFNSLEDTRRAFELGKINGMTSTLTELLQAHERGITGKIIIATDFSNGADTIIARSEIKDVGDLKGKTVGVEPATLGAFIVSRALNSAGLSLQDVKTVGLNPYNMEEAILTGTVDAVHAYPPISLAILKHTDKVIKIFDSSQMPGEIVDIVSLNPEAIARHPNIVPAIEAAWDKAKAYADAHPGKANEIMAKIEGISAAEFAESLKGIKMLSFSEQQALMRSPELPATITKVGAFMAEAGELKNPVPPPKEFMLDATAKHP